MENEKSNQEQLNYDINAFFETFAKGKGSSTLQLELLLKENYYTVEGLSGFDHKRIEELSLGLYPMFIKKHGKAEWADKLNFEEKIALINNQITQTITAAKILFDHPDWLPHQAFEKILQDQGINILLS